MKKIKLLELFGGIGAPRKALENLGFDIKLIDYVEISKYAVEAYNKLYNENYSPQNILQWKPKNETEIDLLVHGSPCQDFSTAGKNDLSNGRSILYLRTLEIIEKELNPRPKLVVWENVKGLINKKNFFHFQHYLDTLEKFGYKNYWKVLNAKDYAIPQNRERIFVISIRQDLPQTFNFDNLEKTEMKSLKSFLEPNENVPHDLYIRNDTPSMIKAIKNGKVKVAKEKVPIVKNYKNFFVLPRKSDNKLINGSYNRFWKSDNFIGTLNVTSPIKNAVEVETIKQEVFKRNQTTWNNFGVIKLPLYGFNSENYVFDSQNPNTKTSTLTVSGGRPKIKIAILKDKITQNLKDKAIFLIEGKHYYLRVISSRESWRLMGFEDEDYEKIKYLPKTTKYQLAGNSIVVSVLEAIFKQLLKGE